MQRQYYLAYDVIGEGDTEEECKKDAVGIMMAILQNEGIGALEEELFDGIGDKEEDGEPDDDDDQDSDLPF